MGTPMPFILSGHDQYRSTTYQAKNPIGDPKPETPTPAGSNIKSSKNNMGTTTATRVGRKNGKQGNVSSSSSMGQNKQPQRQRGVGIAQLERMRRMNGAEITNTPNFQQQHLPTTLRHVQVQTTPHPYPFIDPLSAGSSSNNGIPVASCLNQGVLGVQKFGAGGSTLGMVLGFNNNNGVAQGGSTSGQIVHHPGCFHVVGGPDLRFRVLDMGGMGMNVVGGGLEGSLKELPSFPKFEGHRHDHTNALSPPHHINLDGGHHHQEEDLFNFKKKKVTGCNCYGHNMGAGNHEGVEVVAVHRKGNAGPGGKVVMEYGFFPAGKVTGSINDQEDDHETGGRQAQQISAVDDHANKISQSVAPLSYPPATDQPSVALDLSLKL